MGWALTALVRHIGYEPVLLQTDAEIMAYLSTGKARAILLDCNPPNLNGHTLWPAILAQHNIPVILLTSSTKTADAVAALTAGVAAYLTKPYDHAVLTRAIQTVLANPTRINVALAKTRAALTESVGIGHAVQRLVHEIEFLAEANLTILLEGETGTGKELFARAIHNLSPHRNQPFFVVDCGAIPEPLFESELCGYRKGAFTGAEQHTPGILAAANGGSIFFDEIDSLPLSLQPKLLRIIEAREYRPLGSTQVKHLDIHIIAGSAKPLDQLIKMHQFRADLYYRLAECVLRIPPLRERTEDIPHLALRFMQLYNSSLDTAAPTIAPDTLAMLKNYPWPGNVRELRSAIRQTLLRMSPPYGEIPHALFSQALPKLDPLCADGTRPPLPPQDHATPNFCTDMCPLRNKNLSWDESQAVPLTATVAEFSFSLERWIIQLVLQQTKKNKAAAARRLGIDYKTLRNKLHS